MWERDVRDGCLFREKGKPEMMRRASRNSLVDTTGNESGLGCLELTVVSSLVLSWGKSHAKKIGTLLVAGPKHPFNTNSTSLHQNPKAEGLSCRVAALSFGYPTSDPFTFLFA